MSIHISITPDGAATLHGDGTEPETLVAATYAEAQAQAIDKLIARAKAAGEPLHAITDETPPTTLRIEPSGTVTPVPAAEAPSSSPAPTEAQPEQPSAAPAEPARAEVKPAAPEQPVEPTPPPAAAAPAQPATQAPSRPNPFTADSSSAPAPAASRRQVREQRQSFLNQEQREQPATEGWRGVLASMGIRIAPSEAEKAQRIDRQAVSQHWPGPRTIAIVNGKGGASKTPTTILLSAVFARFGGGGVLAYDNNQTRGTLGWRTEQGPHDATILDLLPKATDLLSTGAQSADLAHFVHHQTTDRYDVLRSKPVALAEDQRVDAGDVDAIHQVTSKFYRLIFIDSGNDESDPLWKRMIDLSDQLVVATTTKDEHAEAGALLLEALADRDERSAALADEAVVIVSESNDSAKATEAADVRAGFSKLAREAVSIPYDPAMVDGVLHYDALRSSTQRAWLRAGAAVARGL
ncbi:AAA family ATPase [Nesterenkonia lutea]|uniref:MinD-like ATPase involved in chromosome partitioning or flagellar assembly n=1 Tax=Nesterenkonia lutea TaxID=272919 RepID=A0ABR9JHU8_9MICC|nr:AAA family ATPase [Nesterenkonia lutea]MBE1525497.1 MinD-like ATPase involved in chromosome partitioning or flagellar assembly [Nesterenkonia lutea]